MGYSPPYSGYGYQVLSSRRSCVITFEYFFVMQIIG